MISQISGWRVQGGDEYNQGNIRGVPKPRPREKGDQRLEEKKCVWLGRVGEPAPRAFWSRPFLVPTVIKVPVAGYSAARPEEKAHN